MKKDQISKRLNNAVTLWEDACFLVKQKAIIQEVLGTPTPLFESGLNGPVKHYPDFRRHVLSNAVSRDYDYNRFTGSFEFSAGYLRNVGPLPLNLFSWNRYSRRTFSLSSELQTLLSATSLDNFCWRDIRWPFKSFLLSLEEPILGKGGVEYDLVLVSEVSEVVDDYKDCQVINFMFFSRKLANYKSVNREKIARLVKRGRSSVEKLAKKAIFIGEEFIDEFFITLKSYNGHMLDDPICDSFRGSGDFSAFRERVVQQGFSLESQSEEDEYEEYSVCNKVKHLVISTCLYLESISHSLKKSPRNNSLGVESATKVKSLAVTTPEDIFNVAFERNLPLEVQETLVEIRKSRAGGKKCAHWRIGHWRKLQSGQRFRKVWVRPCLVNKDNIVENSLPLGSKVNLQ